MNKYKHKILQDGCSSNLYSSVAVSSTAKTQPKQTHQLTPETTACKTSHIDKTRMIIKTIRAYQCIKEKFISRHTSQNFSNLTVFSFSKRDNNTRQSVINPSAILFSFGNDRCLE